MLQIGHSGEPDWVIITDDDRVVGLDRSISKFAGDGSDGLNEGWSLIHPYLLNKFLASEYEQSVNPLGKYCRHTAVLYPTKEMAEYYLPVVADAVKKYYGIKKCRVAKLMTIHILETNKDYESYDTGTLDRAEDK